VYFYVSPTRRWVPDPRKPEKLSGFIDAKIRTNSGYIKSAYLSEHYFPFSMDEGKYGRKVDFLKPANAYNVKTSFGLYNKRKKYLISWACPSLWIRIMALRSKDVFTE